MLRAALIFVMLSLAGCLLPPLGLKTEPPVHMAIEAEIAWKGISIPVTVSWLRENRLRWDEAHGWHANWEQTDGSLVRFIDDRHAVVFMGLPGPAYGDPGVYLPDIVLVDRTDLSQIIHYNRVVTGPSVDGSFGLNSFRIRPLDAGQAPRPMSEAEAAFRDELMGSRDYFALTARVYSHEEWSRSSELVARLEGLDGVELLGKIHPWGQPIPGYRPLVNIASILRWPERRYGVVPRAQGDWKLSEYPRVFIHRRGLRDEAAAGKSVVIQYRDTRFDAVDHQMLFDGEHRQLIVFEFRLVLFSEIRWHPPPYGGYD